MTFPAYDHGAAEPSAPAPRLTLLKDEPPVNPYADWADVYSEELDEHFHYTRTGEGPDRTITGRRLAPDSAILFPALTPVVGNPDDLNADA